MGGIQRLRRQRRRSRAATATLIALLILGVTPVVSVSTAPPAAAMDVALDPENLNPEPVPGAGVMGTQIPIGDQNWRVKSFAQIDQRIYVGGSYLEVRENPYAGSPTFPQSFLAAFDLVTNQWISSWTPTLNGPVWALDVSPSGQLLVGGEFTTVNGSPRIGLVALDPLTGAVDPTFDATIANAGSPFPPSVRDLELVGNELYVGGDFNRIVEGGVGHGVYQVGRVDATTGNYDSSWFPRPSGGAVWDVAVDTARGKVHLAGQFTSVNAQPSTRTGAAVLESDGESVANHPFALNGNWSRTYGVVMAGGNAWYAGEQHYMHARDGDDYSVLGCIATGYSSINPNTCFGNWVGGANGGGDYQVIEEIDGYIVAGCHCRANHWNSFTQVETDLDDRGMKIYNPDGTETSFFPGAIYWNEGPYAAFKDTRGCLYIGGDFVGNAYGFARYCGDEVPDVTPPTTPPNVTLSTNGVDQVTVDWDPSTDDVGVTGYLVHRDYQYLAYVPAGTTYVDNSVAAGETYRYQVRAQDAAGNNSPPSPIELITVGAGDTTPPSIPPNVTLSTNGVDQVTVDWDPSTDNVGVAGYLVHRDYQYLAWVPAGTIYVDNTVASNQTYRYQVRAQDAAGNNSPPSPIEVITVGAPDVTPPTTPPNVVLSTNGVNQVTIDWDPSTDNVGVAGYLVHRNYQFLAWVPAGTIYVDTTVAAGQTYGYQVRAQDAAGNNSIASAFQTIQVTP